MTTGPYLKALSNPDCERAPPEEYECPERNLMPSAISDVVPPLLQPLEHEESHDVWNSWPATSASSPTQLLPPPKAEAAIVADVAQHQLEHFWLQLAMLR